MATYIARKGDNQPGGKPISKTGLDTLRNRLTLKARKPRPNLLAIFLPARAGTKSAFYRLPIVPSAVVNNPAAIMLDGPDGQDAPAGKRWIDMMVIVPDEPSGAKTTAENVRLFVKNHLREVANPDDLAVIDI